MRRPPEKIGITFGHGLEVIFDAVMAPEGPLAANPESNAAKVAAWCHSFAYTAPGETPVLELSPRDWRALRGGLLLCLAWSPSFLGDERGTAAAMILKIDDALEEAAAR